MKIGNIDLGPRPLLLAPMEDVTDIGFRLLCRKMGAAMVYSEFVAADALVRNVGSTLRKLSVCADERPVAIQIYGKDPASMRDAAQMVAEQAHPDVLDLNFGCPVKRVAGKGAGAGLLQNAPLMLEIARTVVQAVAIPVTAKTRLGWDCQHIIIDSLAEQLQDVGLQALTIHGRTRSEMYRGEAHWAPIARVKANPRLHIPIIGNGDVTTPERALACFEQTGVDAVMVGRATFGQPWVFKLMRDAVQPEPWPVDGVVASDHAPLSPDWMMDVLQAQVCSSVQRLDERRGILHIRRHLAATPLFKGIPNFRDHRVAMLRAETVGELFALMDAARPLVRRAAAQPESLQATSTQNLPI